MNLFLNEFNFGSSKFPSFKSNRKYKLTTSEGEGRGYTPRSKDHHTLGLLWREHRECKNAKKGWHIRKNVKENFFFCQNHPFHDFLVSKTYIFIHQVFFTFSWTKKPGICFKSSNRILENSKRALFGQDINILSYKISLIYEKKR